MLWQELRRIFINIVDFYWSQHGIGKYDKFPKEKVLRVYCKATGKIFPLGKAKRQPVLRWMLIEVFRE
jgi:hypothetical protein